DPNDDIRQWIWTKPTVNKDDGTPAGVRGSLSGSGGTLTFPKVGAYDVGLKVIDNTQLEDAVTKEIKIIPPIAVARITTEGTLKRNRKVTVHLRDSLSPRVDPIQTDRNIWRITPLDGQDPNSIKIDPDTSNLEEKNIVFKETGRYEVYLKVHNDFSDNNPAHPNIGACETTEIITIAEDLDPVADFAIKGANPNFIDHPVSTTVDINQLAYSIDADIIDKYRYVLYRDMDEDGEFGDESIYGSYTVADPSIVIRFQQGVSGMFKMDLEVTEEFGQPTIDKFVSVGDRRKNVSSKTFNVNWRPDIAFDIPDWAYTDDILHIKTVLKDEEIDKLHVDWRIKRASEHNTGVMVNEPIDTRTDNILENNGGAIRFKDSGYYELIATVTDEIGQSYTFSDFIRVYPLPTAIIKDGMTYRGTPFTTKENRKYQLNGNSSYAHDYYGAERHTINRSLDYWEIIPLDGQNANQVIKVANRGGSLASDIASSSKYQKSNNAFQEDLLFKLEGRYRVRYQVTNTYGKKSPFAEKVINVVKDTNPIINFKTIETTYRDPDDSNKAEMIAHNITSRSDDDDILTQAFHRIRYRFDSDNDGNFNDETWSSPLTIDFTGKRTTVKVTHVGKYQFEYFVKDTFGQDTLPQFVTTADRRESVMYREVEVDNMSPNVDFTVTPSNKVDVVFTIGQIDSAKTQELNSKINTYIKSYLEANNADFIDTNIEMIETGSIEVISANPQEILDTWRKWGQSADWVVDGTQNAIKDPKYHCAQAGYSDTRPQTSLRNFTFSYEIMGWYHNRYGDNMGVTFRIKDPDNYYALMWRARSSCGTNFTTERGRAVGLTQGGIDLIKVTNGIPAIVGTARIGEWQHNVWYGFEIEAYGSNIKINHNGGTIINYTDNNNPILQGNIGVAAVSHAPTYWRKLNIETSSIKSLDEVLKQPTWREDATKFVVNLSDVKLPELEPTSPKYPVVLSRMLDESLYFAELGTNANKAQTENFISDNDGNGTFIYNNSPNMDKALQDLAEWILQTVRSKARPS
ncbi:MAG: DUF1080 domain-containing protein, partial [Desulfobacterales bacterium]|nr:DUF1080 domain-containing protein [Desulfobacterales bacterium]